MTQFNFFLDEKVTTWFRTYFQVDAETIEEARQMAIKKIGTYEIEELPWVQIDGTIERLKPEDNGNCETQELYDSQNKLIFQNNVMENN